ncbi:MAG: CoA-binding protein [Calditrichaeota bacterium]|nr:MAG: CoA-binding protein [Calditrichota bacterium]
MMPTREAIATLLKKARRIAIVGASPNFYRPSYDIGHYLLKAGYTIIPVNPNHETILGQRCYPDLLSIPEPVDIVNVFRRSSAVPEIVAQAIQKKAPVLWLQLGVHHPEAEERARRAGLTVISGLCIMVVHRQII